MRLKNRVVEPAAAAAAGPALLLLLLLLASHALSSRTCSLTAAAKATAVVCIQRRHPAASYAMATHARCCSLAAALAELSAAHQHRTDFVGWQQRWAVVQSFVACIDNSTGNTHVDFVQLRAK
jgi:hypothetical protein